MMPQSCATVTFLTVTFPVERFTSTSAICATTVPANPEIATPRPVAMLADPLCAAADPLCAAADPPCAAADPPCAVADLVRSAPLLPRDDDRGCQAACFATARRTAAT